MQSIYIILSHTGTLLSRIIKFGTKCEFAHASIALDEDLEKMYSFGRLDPYNPFIGGFVHEHIHSGTFKRFHNTVCRIYKFDVSDEEYDNAKAIIEDFNIHKSEYKFDILGMFLVGLNVDFKRDKMLYCASFVKFVIDNSGIDNNLNYLISPEDFKALEELDNTSIVYNGKLSDYR